jgi:beta-lactamase class A
VRNRNTNIVLRGTAILLLIIATVLTIVSLVAYSRQRNSYPPGMTIAGVPVGGLEPQAASQRLLQVYSTPVEIQYGGGTIQVEPQVLGFQMDIDSMLAAADITRTGGLFWTGWWDYLWNRDPAAQAVPLRATIDENRLKLYLENEIAPRYDSPSAPAQPIPGTTRFTPGEPGQTLDVERAVPVIEDALRSPASRAVTLTSMQNAAAGRPTLPNLETLMKQQITTAGFDGTIGVYMLDLQNGQEIHFALSQGQDLSVNPTDVPFTASSTMKIPILVAYFIGHGPGPIDPSVDAKIVNMIHKSDNVASDDVMAELDPATGPLIVSQDMKKLGLQNTFMAGFFAPGSPILQRFTTPANSRTDVNNDLDTYNQTTPSDIGMLLGDVYECAENGGGALVAAFPGRITKDGCKQIIQYLESDKIGIFLEAGVPEGTEVAHKHGWVPVVGSNGIVADWSDAGIVYTPGGNFVLCMYAHHPVQIVFDDANHLFANLTQATYNYYNTSP